MFSSITIGRLSAPTVYKLFALGLCSSLTLLGLFFGVLALFGAGTVMWNGVHLTGFTGLVAGPVMGLMFGVMATLVSGSMCLAGLGLYSLWRPLVLVYREAPGAGEKRG